jgi:hypothetical protein
MGRLDQQYASLQQAFKAAETEVWMAVPKCAQVLFTAIHGTLSRVHIFGGPLYWSATNTVGPTMPLFKSTGHSRHACCYSAVFSRLMICHCLSRPQEQRAAITAKMQARSDQLMATYTQIALQFADLHDRPERMLAKDAISRIVDWKAARVTFYWRLKRRVLGVWSVPCQWNRRRARMRQGANAQGLD